MSSSLQWSAVHLRIASQTLLTHLVRRIFLQIQHLSTKYEPYLQDVTFDVRKGEIFGLYGLVGAGRTELLETIFGVRTRAAGRVYVNGHLMNFSTAAEAMDHALP